MRPTPSAALLTSFLLLLAGDPAVGQSASASFRQLASRPGGGGDFASSSSFVGDAAIGQTAIGPETSSSVRDGRGFLYMIDPTNAPLPVELASFEGTTTESGVRLTWRTASEQNNAGFQVQRKAQGATMHRGAHHPSNWQTVGRVDGAGTTNQPQTYQFADTDLPYAADALSYRLRQVDRDGTVHTTAPITVERGVVERITLKEPFPNPAHSQVTLRYAIPEGSNSDEVTVRLYDVLGRQVHTVTKGTQVGRHELQLAVRDLASGVYVVRLTAGEQARTRRVTVVR